MRTNQTNDLTCTYHFSYSTRMQQAACSKRASILKCELSAFVRKQRAHPASASLGVWRAREARQRLTFDIDMRLRAIPTHYAAWGRCAALSGSPSLRRRLSARPAIPYPPAVPCSALYYLVMPNGGCPRLSSPGSLRLVGPSRNSKFFENVLLRQNVAPTRSL